METDGDQKQQSSANGSAPSGTNSRPSPMNSMSLYERQAVQALQALQRQPNAAQYFQQLMLQQQINTAQLQNLAAVQQATLAASRQSSPSSQSQSAGTTVSQSQSTSTAVTSVNVTTSGGGTTTNSRTIGLGSSATSTISQSVLLSGSAGGQGQMYLRVNRSLRAPIPSQLIFMPGSTATAAVATVTQQPQAHQQQQQQQEGTPTSTSSSLSDSDQVQNLVLRGSSGTKGVGVKTEAPERGDSGGQKNSRTWPPKLAASYSLIQPVHQQLPGNPPPSPSNKPSSHPQPTQLTHIKIPTYPQSSKPGNPSPGSSIPLSQLLLHGPSFASGRAITTVTAAAANATHILVPTSSSQSRGGYPVGAATVKPPGAAAQTLVVQPLQKASSVGGGDKAGGAHGNGGPVPIQPKTLQGLRLPPLQLPSRNPPPILPAPPSSVATAPPPHIPVQIVGARQSALGNSQALGLAQARTSCSQDGGPGGGLLTTVASSREGGGAAGRGAGLKSLQSWQEALPLAHVSQRQPPTANQSPARICTSASSSALLPAQSSSSSVSSSSSLSHSSLPLPPSGGEESRGAAAVVVTTNGDAGGGPTSQGKQPIGSLKRKSESDVTAEDDGPPPPHLQPMRERPAPPLSSSAVEAGPGHSSPPPPSPAPPPSLSASRLGGGPGERAAPPQAVVKPHVLTHLIEGFVIQEGAEPFPVCGPVKEPAGEDLTNDNPDASQSESVTPATVLKCEYCKSFAPASQFRGTKRFCSMTCAKRYNVSFRMRQGHHHSNQGHHQGNQPSCLSQSDEDGVMRRRLPRRTSSEIASAKIAGRPLPVKCRSESSHSDEASSGEEEDEEDDALSLSPASSTSCHQPPPALPLDGSAPHFLPGSPAQWSVEEVSQFISSLHGCEELAAHFLSQEIDGQALLLLREEHLMSTMNIKLGPALKICAHINTLRD